MRLIALLLAVGAAFPALAQETRRPLFEAGVFGGGGSLPDYPAASQNHLRGLVLPYVIYRGEVLRSDDRGLRGRLYRSQDLEFNLSFNGSLGASSRDNRARQGMPDLDPMGEVGPALRWVAWRASGTSGTRRRVTLEAPLRAVFSTDLEQVNFRGVTLAPELAFEQLGVFHPGDRARIGIGPVLGSGRYMDYFYRVEGQYGRPGRPAYDASGGYLGTRLQFSYRVPVTDRLSLGAGGRFENFSGATNAGSPLFRREFNASIIGGLSYSLYQSAATVTSTAEPFD